MIIKKKTNQKIINKSMNLNIKLLTRLSKMKVKNTKLKYTYHLKIIRNKQKKKIKN